MSFMGDENEWDDSLFAPHLDDVNDPHITSNAAPLTFNNPSEDIADVFSDNPGSRGGNQLFSILQDPDVSQITINNFQTIAYVTSQGPVLVSQPLFANSEQYIDWLNQLLLRTDAGYNDVKAAKTSVIEASFTGRTVLGSIHICTSEITKGDPVLTIRKQPKTFIPLEAMYQQRMMSPDMRNAIEAFTRGRVNILISGGSGAGKSTLAKALAQFIDPWNRVITIEDIDELHLDDIIRGNVVSLTTYKKRNSEGQVVRETDLNDLVKEALRMRADRIWVGETRGKEAYSLAKAALSGHAGCVTTIHANTGAEAVDQLVTYVQEGGISETLARDLVARSFDIVIQIEKVRPDRRVITEILELEPVRESVRQRTNALYLYNPKTDTFVNRGIPTDRLTAKLGKYGAQL